jgi:hypothetical protein
MLKKRRHLHLKKKAPKLKPTKSPSTVVASIRMRPELKKEVQKLADRDQRTFNGFLNKTLTALVKNAQRNDWKDKDDD